MDVIRGGRPISGPAPEKLPTFQLARLESAPKGTVGPYVEDGRVWVTGVSLQGALPKWNSHMELLWERQTSFYCVKPLEFYRLLCDIGWHCLDQYKYDHINFPEGYYDKMFLVGITCFFWYAKNYVSLTWREIILFDLEGFLSSTPDTVSQYFLILIWVHIGDHLPSHFISFFFVHFLFQHFWLPLLIWHTHSFS